jgi:hypothetical protein
MLLKFQMIFNVTVRSDSCITSPIEDWIVLIVNFFLNVDKLDRNEVKLFVNGILYYQKSRLIGRHQVPLG